MGAEDLLGGRGQRGLGLPGQRLEGLRLGDGKIGENFAVDLDAGVLEAVDKSAVGQAVLAGGGIDALNPEGAKIALARAAVAIGVLQPLLDPLDGDAEIVLVASAIALGGLADLGVAGVGGDAPFDSGQGAFLYP